MQTNKAIRKNAAGTLLADGNIYSMSLGASLCVSATAIPIILGAVISSFSELAASEMLRGVFAVSSVIVPILFCVFLTIPVIGGFFDMSHRLHTERDVHVAEVFAPFTSLRRYFRTVRVWLALSLSFLLPLAIPLAAVALTRISDGIFKGGIFFFYLARIAIGFAATVVFAAAVFFMVSFFLTPYFVCRGFGARSAMIMSARATAKKRVRIWKYIFGFSGMFVLSLLSVGMLFVIYTLPVMMLAYFEYAEKMIDDSVKNIEKRGNQNEG